MKRKKSKRPNKPNTIKKREQAIQDDIKRRQKLFSQIYENKACNISLACKAVNIGRTTFYDWCNKYPEFAKRCDEIENGLMDMAESQLCINIRNGKEASLIFFLCNRRPERWKNVQKIEGGDVDKPIQIVVKGVDLSKYPETKEESTTKK